MSELNELFYEIDKLEKQLENEPKNAERRKYKIKYKIKKLREEREIAHRRHDLLLQRKIDAEIEELNKYDGRGFEHKYKLDIDNCKKRIINIILNYYKKGVTIEDIIKLENISQSVYEKWFNLSNFGKNTGYLFIDELDDEFNWIYSNPINEISFKSKYFEELRFKIKENNEILYIFNENLANEVYKRNLRIHQETINFKLSELELKDYKYAMDIFSYLREYASKFNEIQISKLCEIMIENPSLNRYAKYFNDIVDLNRDYFDDRFYEDVYRRIIDNVLNNFKDNYYYSLGDLFSNLKEYSNKFTKDQIMDLSDILIDENNFSIYSNDFNYILSVNSDKIDSNFCDKFYGNLIDNHIEKLSDSSYIEEYNIFNDLNELANKFSKKQLIELSNYAIFKCNISEYSIKLNHIFELNKDKLDSKFFDEFYENFINVRIKKLGGADLELSDQRIIFNDLTEYSTKFSENQLISLYNLVFDKDYIFDNYAKIDYILNVNENYQDIINYNKFIECGLKKLEDNNGEYYDSYDLFEYLRFYSKKFSEKQLDYLCKILISNAFIYNFAQDFIIILEDNSDIFNKSEEVYKKIIDSRINILKDYHSETNICNFIITDLKQFTKNFDNNQFNNLYSIIINNFYISCSSNDLMYIIQEGEYALDDVDTDKIYRNIVENRIQKLNEIDSIEDKIYLFVDLKEYSKWITENQIISLCEFIQDNKLRLYSNENIINFLEKNKNKFEKNIDDEICSLIIDLKLLQLNNVYYNYKKARIILGFLISYDSKFTKTQMINLCNIAIGNDQVYNCKYCKDNLVTLLKANKDLVDVELYNQVVLKNGLTSYI